MVDNYDSFTYNLAQYFEELGAAVEVTSNDKISLEDIMTSQLDQIVISPGPKTPDDSGISLSIVREFAGKVPLLGVCLGHQCIAQVFGATIVRATRLMHGKTSSIYHNNVGVFQGLPNPFQATRYHSLSIDPQSLPECLEITAWTETREGDVEDIMGIKHKDLIVEGVQFHPESILTEHGHQLLNNFLRYAQP